MVSAPPAGALSWGRTPGRPARRLRPGDSRTRPAAALWPSESGDRERLELVGTGDRLGGSGQGDVPGDGQVVRDGVGEHAHAVHPDRRGHLDMVDVAARAPAAKRVTARLRLQ